MSELKPIHYHKPIWISGSKAEKIVKKMYPLPIEKSEGPDADEFIAAYGFSRKLDGPIDACVSMGTTSADLYFNEGDFNKKGIPEGSSSTSILFHVYPRGLNCQKDRSGSEPVIISLEPGQTVAQIYGGFYKKDDHLTDFLITISGPNGTLVGAFVFVQKK